MAAAAAAAAPTPKFCQASAAAAASGAAAVASDASDAELGARTGVSITGDVSDRDDESESDSRASKTAAQNGLAAPPRDGAPATGGGDAKPRSRRIDLDSVEVAVLGGGGGGAAAAFARLSSSMRWRRSPGGSVAGVGAAGLAFTHQPRCSSGGSSSSESVSAQVALAAIAADWRRR